MINLSIAKLDKFNLLSVVIYFIKLKHISSKYNYMLNASCNHFINIYQNAIK